LEKLEENHLEVVDFMNATQWTKPFGPITITIPKISNYRTVLWFLEGKKDH
jgi:hypothetical protein